MSGNKWTNEQLEAINESGCNLLVAAAAGAGKTAVLVERIIKKITSEENPVDIDNLLVVTFTNAAATEMKERIADAISKELENNSNSKLLQRQLTLLNKANITTMHSFCLDVIKNNFHLIDLDPDFRIADETETILLKMEAMDELFDDIYENEEGFEHYYDLLESYGSNRDDSAIQDMVLTLYEFVQSSPWPDEWLKEHLEYFDISEKCDFAETPWGKELTKNLELELEGLLNLYRNALSAINNAQGLDSYIQVFEDEMRTLKKLLDVCRNESENKWNKIKDIISSFEFARLPRSGKDADKSVQEFVKSARDEVKSNMKKFAENMFWGDSESMANNLRLLYPLTKCLADLVLEFERRYNEKKKARSLLDFNDLEHLCLRILMHKDDTGRIYPTETAIALREKFAEILVDEYQDTNMVQEMIVKMVSKTESGTPNVFMVGDVKQSIYRFRQSRPELFMDKYNSYSMEKGDKFRKILLYKNFRSRKEVIDSVNYIFRQIMSVDAGELDYDENEELNPGADYKNCSEDDCITGGPVELHLIDTKDGESEKIIFEEETDDTDDSSDAEEEQLDSVQCEARVIINRIKELVNKDGNGKCFMIYDKTISDYRPVEYRDIVILMRSTRNWTDTFMEEMSAQGIPAYADSGTGFFKTVEIQIMLSLLQIIDNPVQDIPLLAVLRSPIVGLTPEELTDIRLANRNASIYDALKTVAEQNEGELSTKAANFIKKLEEWRDKAVYMPVDELIWYLYGETGFYSFAGAMPEGEQRQANLRILFERARQYEQTSYKGLFNFINFINKLKNSRGDMGSAKILGENENVVRIMSIHKSKGLEFPVVIVAGCGKKFNLQDMNRSILLHQDLGFGPDYVDYRKRIAYPSAAKQAIRSRIKNESLSEEMRILYVALTRAREKLIITGSVKNLDKSLLKWGSAANVKDQKLPAYDMLKASNYLDWILPALIRHKKNHCLRKSAGLDDFKGALIDDPSEWGVIFWERNDIISDNTKEEKQEEGLPVWMDAAGKDSFCSEFSDEICRRLEWEYKYKKASQIPVKVSVTELKKRFAAETAEELSAAAAYASALIKKPAFLQEDTGLSAAEAGSALHFVMQHLDLCSPLTEQNIAAQIERMQQSELLTAQQAACVDISRICKFADSDLGRRMCASGKVYREVPFCIEIDSSEFTDGLDDVYEGEITLLQGVIDCFFEEDDGLVLIDYKTDYVPQGGEDMIKERYKLQIEYYSRALEKLTGKKVKEKYIYLFWNGNVLEFK